MAYDMTFKVGLEPEVDEKALYRSINKLGTAIRKTKPGTSHANLSKQAGNLIQTLIGTGQFTTPAQAERFMRLMSGGNFSAEQMGIWARGTSMARASQKNFGVLIGSSYSEKQISRMRPDTAQLAAQYNALLGMYQTARQSPTEENKAALLESIKGIEESVNNISKERRNSIKLIKDINKNAKGMQKEITAWQPAGAMRTQAANATGVAAMAKMGFKWLANLFGIYSIIGLFKQAISFGWSGIGKGENALEEQAIYGANRNIAIGRSRALMYGLNEDITAAPERYALDFRQRMMWGEVSDREWIALSRLGGLGQMIISGEAARNPRAFQKGLEQYIRANKGNETEVRQTLSWLGLSPQLMKYGAMIHDEESMKTVEQAYGDIIRGEKVSALTAALTSRLVKQAMDEAQANIARMESQLIAGSESQDFAFRSMAQGSGMTGEETATVYRNLAEESQFYKKNKADINKIAAATSILFPEIGLMHGLYNKNLEARQTAAQNNPINNWYVDNVYLNSDADNKDKLGNDLQNAARNTIMSPTGRAE